MIVLLDDESGVHSAKVRLRHRLGVHIAAQRLDQALANGASPDSTVPLALRAQCLVRPQVRQELAGCLRHALDRATRPSPGGLHRVSISTECVLETRTEVEALVERLSAHAPVAAAGVARVRLLMTDGAGPLYHPRDTRDLRSCLQEAARALDLPAA